MKDHETAARRVSLLSLITAFLAGAITVLGFAPFEFWLIPFFALALLFWQWSLAATPQQAFKTGWVFGLGFFLCGVSWIYVSLHNFGEMPLPIAALATLLFCAFLALFPAVVGYVVARSGRATPVKLMVTAPASWVLLEWIRSWIFTGFPWNTVGYSQIVDSPLAGYAPVAGIYGVSLVVAVMAGCIAVLVMRWRDAKPPHRTRALVCHPAGFMLLGFVVCGLVLKHVEWTKPTGTSTPVSLLQGNVAQDVKWREEQMIATLDTYATLVRRSNAKLIVLPETALPLFLHEVPPDYLDMLAAHAKKNGGDLLLGVPEREPAGDYYNTAISTGSAPAQRYRKLHLVPFGEFIPLRPLLAWIVNILSIPLQDFSRGAIDQQPLNIAGQRVAVNICYEDVFGEEIIRQLPQATMLINISNVAWFGRSIAPRQHLQISQARALETGRYMLRATNTGMTAVIDQRGRLVKVAPEFTTTSVEHTVPGYQGSTPYTRWGNGVALALIAMMLGYALLQRGAAQRNSL